MGIFPVVQSSKKYIDSLQSSHDGMEICINLVTLWEISANTELFFMLFKKYSFCLTFYRAEYMWAPIAVVFVKLHVVEFNTYPFCNGNKYANCFLWK